MSVITIKGKIDSFGESEIKDRSKKYAYITFIDENGKEVLVERVSVPMDIDRIIVPGAEGSFIVSKALFDKQLCAAKVDGADYVTEAVSGSVVKIYGIFYAFMLGALLICGVLSIFIIGIPMALYVIWLMIRFPFYRKEVLSGIKSADISIEGVQRV